jgi:hypothetical protein
VAGAVPFTVMVVLAPLASAPPVQVSVEPLMLQPGVEVVAFWIPAGGCR